ncbi:hypothetical protein AG0111_0g3621 [Alternaria gaisen]|uniref:Uncharacterized protein n=1 Tax=Alternaria gaisen TaxID=167740 RepID=A0ACB6FTU4_9PLEO|nr:hypothetical protein AG0111_0g3621 [Alternaria gaisen]
MHKVYSHSYCNFSAASALDGSQGLFRTRDSQALNGTRIELCVADLDESRSHIQCDIHNYFFWSHNIPGCIINKRAWVVQERLLAPRVLCFGHSHLFWECVEHDAAESYPNGLPVFLQKQVLTNFQALEADTYIRKIEAQGRQVDRDIACYEIWNKIISAYSETLLTVASDKLIALSGISKHMRPSVNNDTYVAGLTHETQDRWRMLVNNVLVRPQDDSLPDWKRIGPLVHLDVPATDDAFVHDMTQQRLFFMVARTPKSDDEYIPILLLRLCNAERRLFERIGIATGGPKSGTEMLLAELDEETTASLSCLRYKKGLHTVRII